MLVAIDENACMNFIDKTACMNFRKFSHVVTSLQERKDRLGGFHLQNVNLELELE